MKIAIMIFYDSYSMISFSILHTNEHTIGKNAFMKVNYIFDEIKRNVFCNIQMIFKPYIKTIENYIIFLF